MDDKQLKKLMALQHKLFEVMVFDCNPAHWAGYKKPASELTKQEKDEASWCRRQAGSSIALWEKIDKLIASRCQPSQPEDQAASSLDLNAIEQEASQLLELLQDKE